MTEDRRTEIESRLLRVLTEIERQENVATSYSANALPFAEEMSQIHEYLESGEYGLAYEILVATIESHPFNLSGKAAVSLLEVGLRLGYKTGRKEDSLFDTR